MPGNNFWETKKLEELSRTEWESLCDGCARCCLIKLEDEDDGAIYYTNVVCDLLEEESCRCTKYTERTVLVPQCVVVRPEVLDQLHWMPSTCAYRLLWEGKPLPEWHPLVSGDPSSVHLAGISVRGRVYRQSSVADDDLQEHVVDWPA